jgi:hypothetical protein
MYGKEVVDNNSDNGGDDAGDDASGPKEGLPSVLNIDE